MKKITFWILLVLGIGVASVGVLAAERRDVSNRIVEVEARIKAWDYEKYKGLTELLQADIASLEEQLAKANRDKKAAEEAGDSLEMLRMELVISNCSKELEEKRKTLAEYQLQMDIDVYYVANQIKLTADKEAQNRCECYNSRLTVARHEARISYLEAAQAELEARLEAEQKKLELGYATETEVNALQKELERTLLMTEESKEEIAFQKALLATYGEEESRIELPHMPEALQDDFVSAFCDNSTQLKYYEQQITAYSNYIDSADKSDENLGKLQLQLELADLNKQQYQLELEKYVRQKEKDYRQSRLKVEEYDCEIAVTGQRMANSELLCEKGKLREIDVLELRTEKARLEYERTCCVCDAQFNRYILENRIEK